MKTVYLLGMLTLLLGLCGCNNQNEGTNATNSPTNVPVSTNPPAK